MPSIKRIPGSPYWIGCFSLPGGVRTSRSTKTKDRTQALKITIAWSEAAKNRASEVQILKVLSDIHERAHGKPVQMPSVAEFAQKWLARKEGEVVGVTVAAYTGTVASFRKFLGANADQPIQHVTSDQIAEWRTQILHSASPRTANNKLKVLRVLFQAAFREGLITQNPAANVATLKAKKSTRRPFTPAELQAILKVAPKEWVGMILFGYYTGQRLKDIASLTWSMLDLANCELRFETSKTSRAQVIPIAKPIATYLGTLQAPSKLSLPVFASAYPLAIRSGGTGVLSGQFHEILAKAGLVAARDSRRQRKGNGRDAARTKSEISFHSLRHTATSDLKRTGASETVVRDIIGHESAYISRQYTHVNEADKRTAIDSLPDISG